MSDGVSGLGGVFFRARDPEALKAAEGNRFELWEPVEGV
jgi:hypothetical protein